MFSWPDFRAGRPFYAFAARTPARCDEELRDEAAICRKRDGRDARRDGPSLTFHRLDMRRRFSTPPTRVVARRHVSADRAANTAAMASTPIHLKGRSRRGLFITGQGCRCRCMTLSLASLRACRARALDIEYDARSREANITTRDAIRWLAKPRRNARRRYFVVTSSVRWPRAGRAARLSKLRRRYYRRAEPSTAAIFRGFLRHDAAATGMREPAAELAWRSVTMPPHDDGKADIAAGSMALPRHELPNAQPLKV